MEEEEENNTDEEYEIKKPQKIEELKKTTETQSETSSPENKLAALLLGS